MGERVQIGSNGKEIEGYLAAAPGGGKGIIVLQEWWGLVGHITEVADRFASAGFTALAPDLYEGKTTTEPDEAGSLMMALNIGETEKTLRGAIDVLRSRPECTSDKVGVVGFCMGGQLSMFAACLNRAVGACVNFYGVHPNVKPDFASLQAPILGLFAENDPYASPEAVAALDAELNSLGKPHEFVTYPGTSHAFFNDHRLEVFDAHASADAWKRVLTFFDTHL